MVERREGVAISSATASRRLRVKRESEEERIDGCDVEEWLAEPGGEKALAAGREGVIDVVEEGVCGGLGQDLEVLEGDGVQDHDRRRLRAFYA